MTLGERIRTLRREKGYSILKLKELTGLSKSTISEIENNKSSPTAKTLETIAKALNVSIFELFDEVNNTKVSNFLHAGEAIKFYRNNNKLSQNDLCKLMNIPISRLNQIENGEVDLEDKEIDSLCKIFNLDKDSLFANTVLDYSVKSLNTKNYSGMVEEDTVLYDNREFKTPEAAMQFILKQPAIMGYGGFDVNKMSDEDVISFANELLNLIKMLSPKYNK